MTVTPQDIGTFLVSSESHRDGVEAYLVDLAFKDEPWHRPRPRCGCHDCFAKGFRVCKHILAVVNAERERLGL